MFSPTTVLLAPSALQYFDLGCPHNLKFEVSHLPCSRNVTFLETNQEGGLPGLLLDHIRLTCELMCCCMELWQVLRIYLDGRKGDPFAAAEILAKSLIWRQQYKDQAAQCCLPSTFTICSGQSKSWTVAVSLDSLRCCVGILTTWQCLAGGFDRKPIAKVARGLSTLVTVR